MTDDWSLKKQAVYLNDQAAYSPDCDHQLWSKELIDKHNLEYDTQTKDCWLCKGTNKIFSSITREEIECPNQKCKNGKEPIHFSKRHTNWEPLYEQNTVETLRKKLIEDIGSYPVPPYDDVCSNDSVRLELINLINKRFGVEK